MMEKVQSMILVMVLVGRNYMRQSTASRGNAVVEKSISGAPFFTSHLPIDNIKWLQEMLVQSVPMNKLMTPFHAHQN